MSGPSRNFDAGGRRVGSERIAMDSMTPGAGGDAHRAGRAYWSQREALGDARDRIVTLVDTVGRPTDLTHYQWAQLMAMALDFKPDLIIELGRGWGNSTVAFTEAAHMMGGHTRVVSLCLSHDWERITLPRIRPVVGEDWFRPLTIHRGDILGWDWATTIGSARRVMLFWDAHGFAIAQEVLAELMPQLAARDHLVLMHDMSDARYLTNPNGDAYGGQPLWRGNSWDGEVLRIGTIFTRVEQAVAILDFTTRNRLPLHSGDEGIALEITSDPARVGEMTDRLGPLFSTSAHWFWFDLAEAAAPHTFPGHLKQRRLPWLRRIREAAKVLLRG